MEQPAGDLAKFSIVRQHRRMLANMNFYLNCKSRILDFDFGCGSGNSVYEYRDAGFDAYGFEISSSVQLRHPEDEKYFRFALTGKPANVPKYAIDKTFYKIPYEDEFFDFIFSTSTFEHVMDYQKTGLNYLKAKDILKFPHIISEKRASFRIFGKWVITGV